MCGKGFVSEKTVNNKHIDGKENRLPEVNITLHENINNFIQKDFQSKDPDQISIGQAAEKQKYPTEHQTKTQISNPYNNITTEIQSNVII